MYWIYFDASALLKRYAHETGTPLINELFHRIPMNRMTCSTLGILEIISILVRKRNDGRVSQLLFDQAMIEFRSEIIDRDDFSATPVDDDLIYASSNLIEKHNLNSNDTIILQSALNFRQALRFQGHDLLILTSDKRLGRAAQAEGLIVFDPEIETIVHLYQLIHNASQTDDQTTNPSNTWDVEL